MQSVMEDLEEKELYLECIGHLIGLAFEPRSSLKNAQPKADVKKESEKDIVLADLPLDKARTWKKGAMTASLQQFGYGLEKSVGRSTEDGSTEILQRFKFKTSEENSNSDISDVKRIKNPVTISGDPGSTKRMKFNDRGTRQSTMLGCSSNTYIDPETEKVINRPFQLPYRRNGVNPNTNLSVQERVKICRDSRKSPPSSSESKGSFVAGSARGLFKSDAPSRKGLFRSITEESSTIANNNISEFESVSSDIVRSRLDKNTRMDEEPSTKENEMPSLEFKTALEQMRINDKAKGIKRKIDNETRVPTAATNRPACVPQDSERPNVSENAEVNELMMNHESLKMFEPAIVERILAEIMEPPQETGWDDVAGLAGPKEIIKEIIIWPLKRPDIFKGLRAAPRGVLLFGPPGTGKTMIGRLISTQSKSTFFSISASSLTSKWIGDGEKIVRALFALARIKQPSVIFIDEIDSIMTQRSDTEHEASRRMKTEFLVQFDGCSTNSEDRVLVIGVTNRPQELDEAARRRLVKRIYIPLPDLEGRKQIVKNLMSDQSVELTEEEYDKVAEITDGYSGADMKNLCHVAANEPIRDISDNLEFIDIADVRAITFEDFVSAKDECSKTVAQDEMVIYENFDAAFGCKLKSKKKVVKKD